MLDALVRFNAFLYHSVEVMLADVHLLWLRACIAIRGRRIRMRERRIRKLEERLAQSKDNSATP